MLNNYSFQETITHKMENEALIAEQNESGFISAYLNWLKKLRDYLHEMKE